MVSPAVDVPSAARTLPFHSVLPFAGIIVSSRQPQAPARGTALVASFRGPSYQDQDTFAAAARFLGSGHMFSTRANGCRSQAATIVVSLVKVSLPISWDPPGGTWHRLVRGMRARGSEFWTRNDRIGSEIPEPVLARFETLDDRVSGRTGMFGGMLARR